MPVKQFVAMDQEFRATLETQRWYLHNITNIDWPTGGRSYPCPMIVAAKKEGQRYATTAVDSAFYRVDMGEDIVERSVSAKDCAIDLANGINGNVGDGAFPSFNGVFASPNLVPSEAELADAEKRLHAFYDLLIKEGDKVWQQFHRPDFISGQMMRAAEHRKVERDWCMKVKPQDECPACGSYVKPGVAICKECHAILDQEKAERFGLIQRIPEPEPTHKPAHKQ